MINSEKMTQMMSAMCDMIDSEDVKPMDPKLMEEMLPDCIYMMLLNVPKEKRSGHIVNIVTSLFEKGTKDMNGEEVDDLKYELIKSLSS